MRKFAASSLAGAALLGLMLAPAHAHDVKVGALTLDHPFSRETPKGARVGAGYVTIRNDGEVADQLIAVACDCAELTEIHEMKMDGAVMRMQALPDGVAIPAGAAVALEPGGRHIMFLNLKDPFKADDRFKATLTFRHAGAVEAEFTVEPLRKPSGANHGGHGKAH